MTVLNNIILLITEAVYLWPKLSLLLIASIDGTATHATPTFITEALCLVTRVQLFLTTVSVD